MMQDVPAGHIAAIVTDLEMTAPPADPGPAAPLVRWRNPDLDAYRALFREIGEDWLWFSRLSLPDEALAAILHDPQVELYAGPDRESIVELDFRQGGSCEVAFFGLVPSMTGRGEGRRLMAAALALAWREGVGRVWLHTCTLDHPAALPFYLSCGFRAVRRRVEVEPDPRLDGRIVPQAASHHPVIR